MPRVVKGKTKGLPERIAEIRRDYGISQEEFGRRIGIRQSAISKYEKGYPMPRVVRIAVAATFGAGLDWLENGQPPKYAKREEFPVTAHDLELLRFLKQQNSLYDLIRGHLSAARRSRQGKR
jgi:transcriptional regulator with XRE-family HTH domain